MGLIRIDPFRFEHRRSMVFLSIWQPIQNQTGVSGFCHHVKCSFLSSQVWRSWREDVILSVIDPSLTTGSRNDILRCIHIGLLCVQESAATRPTMASVALMLNSNSFTLPTPSRPAFVLENVVPLNVSSSTEGLQSSSNDVTVSELSPR